MSNDEIGSTIKKSAMRIPKKTQGWQDFISSSFKIKLLHTGWWWQNECRERREKFERSEQTGTACVACGPIFQR
jgi:hypothetical protein